VEISSQAELIEVADLKSLLAQNAPALRLIHVADPKAFNQAHIPGAICVAPAELVSGIPPAAGKLPDSNRVNALFSRLGYREDAEFVLYDDEGGGWAGRFAWTLDVIGHRRWRYLNGGLHAWAAAGGELAAGDGFHPDETDVTVTVDGGPIASLDAVRAAIDDPEQLIWDVRSREEYLGLRSGSARSGHIPGAVNVDWLELQDPARDRRLRNDLDALLAERNVDLSKRIITHCQSHHRSGLSYMAARLLGCQSIRAYDGSWSEWGNLEDTPIST